MICIRLKVVTQKIIKGKFVKKKKSYKSLYIIYIFLKCCVKKKIIKLI